MKNMEQKYQSMHKEELDRLILESLTKTKEDIKKNKSCHLK